MAKAMGNGVTLRSLGLLLALCLCGESLTPCSAGHAALMRCAPYLPVAAAVQNREEEEMLIGWQGEVPQHIQVRHALPIRWAHACVTGHYL